jgi:hypothetical protein
MKLSLFSALFTLLLVSPTLFAQINFNNVTYGGTGCPQGTVSTAVSPDGSSLSILFDEFRAEVPDYNQPAPRGRQVEASKSLKSCALSFVTILTTLPWQLWIRQT